MRGPKLKAWDCAYPLLFTSSTLLASTRTESELCPPFTPPHCRKRLQTDHQHTARRSGRVNLPALSTAIEMLCLFSYQHCGLLGGDLWSRCRARVAPVEFEQVSANDDPFCLESYFSSSLHRLVPSSSGEFINRRWACDSRAPARSFIASFNEGPALRSQSVQIARARGLTLTTRQTLARMARLSLLRWLEFSFTFFGGSECSL